MTIAKAIAVRDALVRRAQDPRLDETTRENAARVADVIDTKIAQFERRGAS